jgi:hypothetical protein
VPKKPTELEINLKGFSVEEREAIAVEIIDKIRDRTKDGKDKRGNAFAPYSKEYKNSQNFSIAGKDSKVNLTLSGDMLDSMEIISNSAGKVVIGYGPDNNEQGKAEGNILGTYGQDHKVAPKRDFLGISARELKEITDKYKRNPNRAEKILQDVENADILLSGAVDLEELDGES